jgi:hypothetical protein
MLAGQRLGPKDKAAKLKTKAARHKAQNTKTPKLKTQTNQSKTQRNTKFSGQVGPVVMFVRVHSPRRRCV